MSFFRRGSEIGRASEGEFLFVDTITHSFVNLFTNEFVISRTTKVASASGLARLHKNWIK